MDAASRRLAVVGGHLSNSSSSRGSAVAGLAHVLDHDCFELRDRMKQFLQDDIYVPR
jgi:hypothetical protein